MERAGDLTTAQQSDFQIETESEAALSGVPPQSGLGPGTMRKRPARLGSSLAKSTLPLRQSPKNLPNNRAQIRTPSMKLPRGTSEGSCPCAQGVAGIISFVRWLEWVYMTTMMHDVRHRLSLHVSMAKKCALPEERAVVSQGVHARHVN